MVLEMVGIVLLFLVGIAFVFGTYLPPKEMGFASWRRQTSLLVGCNLLMVSMLLLGLQVGRITTEQHCNDSPRAPMAGDPSLPTADPIASGEYIVFATIRMDDYVDGLSCFAVIAPVYGNEVDADAMRIHMATMNGLCVTTDVLGPRWRLRVTPRADGSANFTALLPPSDTCSPTEDDGESYCPRDLAEFARPTQPL